MVMECDTVNKRFIRPWIGHKRMGMSASLLREIYLQDHQKPKSRLRTFKDFIFSVLSKMLLKQSQSIGRWSTFEHVIDLKFIMEETSTKASKRWLYSSSCEGMNDC
nr:12052_t:CDS:2 [Entrophospora candida]